MKIGVRTPREDAKKFFFDRPAVQHLMDRTTARALGFFGGNVRQKARRRAGKKNRGRSSQPGEGPTKRTGLIHQNIFFHADPFSQSVVIGPALLSGGAPTSGPTVPELLEEGGRVSVNAWLRDPETGRLRDPNRVQGRRLNAFFIRDRRAPRVSMRYRPRPFMGPAYNEELDNVESIWRRAAA